MVGLVGPNGAGKTTLLHVTVGLLRPSEGSVEVLGHSPDRALSQLLRDVGFVAQEQPLYRDFSVADMLELGRRLNPRWDAAFARDRLVRHGIDVRRRTGELSGGQHAQVALALALGKRPRLLLLDEPVAHLDPLARREFLAEVSDSVSAHECSVMLSSHLIGDLELVCDYVVIIAAGELQLAGDVTQMLSRHAVVQAGQPLPNGAVAVGTAALDPAHGTLVRFDHAVSESASLSRVDLEGLVLAYLATLTLRPAQSSATPPLAGPAR